MGSAVSKTSSKHRGGTSTVMTVSHTEIVPPPVPTASATTAATVTSNEGNDSESHPGVVTEIKNAVSKEGTKKSDGGNAESVRPPPSTNDAASTEQTDLTDKSRMIVLEKKSTGTSARDNTKSSGDIPETTPSISHIKSNTKYVYGESDVIPFRDSCFVLTRKIVQDFSESEIWDSVNFVSKLRKLNNTYLNIDRATPAVAFPLKKEVTDDLIAQGVDDSLFAYVLKNLPKTRSSDSDVTAEDRKALEKVVGTLLNFTDVSIALSIKVCQKSDLLETLSEALLYHGVFTDERDADKDKLIYIVTGILYNCSLKYENRKRLRDVGLVWILKRLMGSGHKYQALTATLALAGILDEEESKFFNSEIACITLLVTVLNEAVRSQDRRHDGYSAKGLATACGRLAGNDATKKVLVDVGMLDCLLALCDVGDHDEQKEALGALWALAFDDDNKKKMLEKENLIETLMKLRKSPDEGVKTESLNTLWTLRDQLQSSSNPEYRKLGEELSTSAAHSSSSSEEHLTSGKHVMISYSWANKIIVFKVHEELEKNGYRVWIDRNEMKGSIIDSIADGVENADVMLMCTSQKYKTSKYCRAEAEYAFTRDINIIPLLMESDFKADGWLGLIKGAKKHFDFGQLDYFDVTFPNLTKELGQSGKGFLKAKGADNPDSVVQTGTDASTGQNDPHVTSGHGTVVSRPFNHMNDWSPMDVRKWLEDKGCYRNVFEKMTGRQLLFLKNLEKRAPEYFYSYLKTDLNMKDIESLADLVYALESL